MITYTWGNPKIIENEFGDVIALIISMKGVDENNTIAISSAHIGVGVDNMKPIGAWTEADTDIQKEYVQMQLQEDVEKNIDLINNPPALQASIASANTA